MPARRGLRRRGGRSLDRHALRPADRCRVAALVVVRRRAGLPAEHRLGRAAGRRSPVDRSAVRRRGRRRRRSRHASGPRSSSSRSRSTCTCGDLGATPCCTRPSPTRPTRWAPSSPVVAPVAVPPHRRRRPRPRRRSTRPTRRERSCCGSTARATRPARSTTCGARRRGVGRHGVPVASDECYAEFTWADRPRTILEHGLEGVLARPLAVEAVEPRRCYGSGSTPAITELVGYLQEVRKHAGLMVPGPAQHAAAVGARRRRPRRRATRSAICAGWSASPTCCLGGRAVPIELPAGGFYLWFDAGDGWAFAERLAHEGGALVSPGDFYGAGGAQNVRVAVVQPDDRLELVARRLGVS